MCIQLTRGAGHRQAQADGPACTFLLFRSGLMPIPGSSCMIIVMCQKDSKRFVCITSKRRYCSSCLLLFRPGISSPNRVDSEGGGFAAAPSEAAGCNRSPRASSERQEAAPEGENGSQPRVDQGVLKKKRSMEFSSFGRSFLGGIDADRSAQKTL